MLIGLATSILSRRGAAGPALPFADNFNRADENFEASANWTRVDGTAGMGAVSGNAARCTTTDTDGAAYQSPDKGSLSQYVQAKLLRNSASAATYLAAHLTDRHNYIGIRWNANNVLVFKRVAGVLTQISSTANTFGATKVVRLETNGSTYTVKVDGVAILTGASITSGPPASTRTGFNTRGEIANFADDYEAGIL